MHLNGFTFYFVRITARPENLQACALYQPLPTALKRYFPFNGPAYFGDPTCYLQYGMKRECAQCADLA